MIIPMSMNLSATNHVFYPRFPVPDDQVRDTEGAIFPEHCDDCESGAGQPDLHPIDGLLWLVVRSINDWNGCVGVRLPIRNSEELDLERPGSQLCQLGVYYVLALTRTVHDPQVNIQPGGLRPEGGLVSGSRSGAHAKSTPSEGYPSGPTVTE
jgi:hypothetical protein